RRRDDTSPLRVKQRRRPAPTSGTSAVVEASTSSRRREIAAPAATGRDPARDQCRGGRGSRRRARRGRPAGRARRRRGGLARRLPIRLGLTVPIGPPAAPLGALSIVSRGEAPMFEEQLLDDLEEIAARAAPAIESALRLREAQRGAHTDPLTELYNRRHFDDAL